MPGESVSSSDGNRRYQADLAAVLVSSLGFDAALETCRTNGWDGVLGILLAQRTATIWPFRHRRSLMALEHAGHK